MSARWTDGEGDGNLDVVLRRRMVRAAFQPIVRLDSGLTAALRASVRGPLSSPLERSEQLFAAAARRSRVSALDALCCDVIVEAAERAKLHAPLTVFVDRDVVAFASNRPAPAADAAFPIVVTFDATASPRPLLEATTLARELGYRVALRIVDERAVVAAAATGSEYVIVDAETLEPTTLDALAHGVTLVAAGVDNELAMERATSLGIHYACGLRFGRPDLLVRAPVLFDRAGIVVTDRSNVVTR